MEGIDQFCGFGGSSEGAKMAQVGKQHGPQNYKAAMQVIAAIRRNCEHDWQIAGSGVFDKDKRQFKRYWTCDKCLVGMYSFEMPEKKGNIGDNTPIVD